MAEALPSRTPVLSHPTPTQDRPYRKMSQPTRGGSIRVTGTSFREPPLPGACVTS